MLGCRNHGAHALRLLTPTVFHENNEPLKTRKYLCFLFVCSVLDNSFYRVVQAIVHSTMTLYGAMPVGSCALPLAALADNQDDRFLSIRADSDGFREVVTSLRCRISTR